MTAQSTALYLDEGVLGLERGLAALGCTVFTTVVHGNRGALDAIQLKTAVALHAILVTNNRHDFELTHNAWRTAGVRHFGIISFRGLRRQFQTADQVQLIDGLLRHLRASELENLMWVWEAASRRWRAEHGDGSPPRYAQW